MSARRLRRRSEPTGGTTRLRSALRRHPWARLGTALLLFILVVTVFAGFFSPYGPHEQNSDFSYAPPSRLHFRHQDGFGLRPFVYRVDGIVDPETYVRTYVEDVSTRYYVRLFARGTPYRLLGLFPTNVHLFGVRATDGSEDARLYLFGADAFGRCLFSRCLAGGRVSLAVGPFVILLLLPIAVAVGGFSGYFGGAVDVILQRISEAFMIFPGLPVVLVVGAALSALEASSLVSFFGVMATLAVLGWARVARVLRGQVIALRERDFVVAARASGASDLRVLFRHILPHTSSYLIVTATLLVPGMMLTEASLSFLGFGLREPMVSWGGLLNAAMDVSVIDRYPWTLIPAAFIIASVIALNLIGEGLRDAVDALSRASASAPARGSQRRSHGAR